MRQKALLAGLILFFCFLSCGFAEQGTKGDRERANFYLERFEVLLRLIGQKDMTEVEAICKKMNELAPKEKGVVNGHHIAIIAYQIESFACAQLASYYMLDEIDYQKAKVFLDEGDLAIKKQEELLKLDKDLKYPYCHENKGLLLLYRAGWISLIANDYPVLEQARKMKQLCSEAKAELKRSGSKDALEAMEIALQAQVKIEKYIAQFELKIGEEVFVMRKGWVKKSGLASKLDSVDLTAPQDSLGGTIVSFSGDLAEVQVSCVAKFLQDRYEVNKKYFFRKDDLTKKENTTRTLGNLIGLF